MKDEIVGYKKADKEYVVSINYPDILAKVKIDEYIYLYDGTIRANLIIDNGVFISCIECSIYLSL